MSSLRFAVAMLGCLGAVGCATDVDTASTTLPADFAAERCIVWLHGRSDTGAEAIRDDRRAELSPAGNDRFPPGHQWLYDTDERFQEARDIVAGVVDDAGCRRVVVRGFSNGAAFAGHLLCQGEDLQGRLVGVVVDDPVPDRGTVDCAPAVGVEAAVYWTGALGEASPGTSCASLGWTCLGEELVGIQEYASNIGVPVLASPFVEHTWHREAPEIDAWLGLDG